ncbi:MAG: hypothetical protein RLZZ450_2648 [Pseudomonadota bacterium]|jgi:hypothetical protein
MRDAPRDHLVPLNVSRAGLELAKRVADQQQAELDELREQIKRAEQHLEAGVN